MHHPIACRIALLISLVVLAGCRPGTPVIDPSAAPSQRDGTIAGHVLGPDGKAPLADRVVRARSVGTGESYEARTNATGGYTIKVPPGDYTVELVLQQGERLQKQPGRVHINPSDLDPNQDFVLAGAGGIGV